ncbi:MAG: N-formylglutamate amidohydrolase [Kiritimatiellae bacterium]|nr:N-formylglutamate amidohydrolase [Kiritimatiellia bacterium]
MVAKFDYTNIVLAVPHAVGEPLDYDWREDAKVAASARRWTDWHTDKLFSIEGDRISVVKGRLSRFDCDDERLEDEADRICRYAIEGGICQREIGARQWNARLAEWFRYRAELMSAAARGEMPLIIDCHSFPSDLAPDVDICIGFNEDGSKPSEEVLNCVSRYFEAVGYKVTYNNPYSNAIAPVGYRGNSLMIEVNKRCYLDADEVNIGEGFAMLHKTLVSLYEALLGRRNWQYV